MRTLKYNHKYSLCAVLLLPARQNGGDLLDEVVAQLLAEAARHRAAPRTEAHSRLLCIPIAQQAHSRSWRIPIAH
eukprot:g35329.t1